MKTLYVSVSNKIATASDRNKIVCGNTDYEIQFSFDSEWDSYTEKVARFIWNNQYTDVRFSGTTCVVPMLSNTTQLTVGVYAGELCTTTPAEIECRKSIRCAGGNQTEEDRNYTSVAENAAMQAQASEASASESATVARECAEITQGIAADSVNMEARISRNDKRITNLEQGITPDPFETDDSVAYVKDVPANALPYAEIEKVGGMTRKCTNLIPFPYFTTKEVVSGVTFKVNQDQSITVSGTATAMDNFIFTKSMELKHGVTYQLAPDVIIYYINAEGTGKYGEVKLTWDDAFTFVHAYTLVRQDVTYSKTIYPMVNEGDARLPYEPYFEGLRSAKVTEIESIGANASPITTPQSGYFYDSGGTASGAYSRFICFYVLDVKENTKYTISSNLRFYTVWYADGATALYKDIVESTKFTFTTPAKCNQLRITVYNTSGAEDTTAFQYFMINHGATMLPYVPYSGKHTLPIPQAVQDLDGYGLGVNATYHNYVDWENKRFVQRVGEFVLNGSEPLEFYHNRFKLWGFAKAGVHPPVICVSNKYVYEPTVTSDGATKTGVLVDGDILYIRDMAYTSLDSFKAYLAEQYANRTPVTIVYALAEPIETDITDLLTVDNFIAVEGGGTITMVNDHGLAVPSEITYMVKEVNA